jgi:hypothetical protein
MKRSLRGQRRDGRALDNVAPLPGVPLLDHLEALLPADGRGPLAQGGEPLPDEPPPDPNEMRFTAGSLDGVSAVRGGTGASQEQEPLVAAAATLDVLRSQPTSSAVHLVAKRLAMLEGPTAFDRLLSAINAARGVDRQRLATLARWLCTHGVDRQQVKAGLALLGVSGTPEDRQLITKLGLLEELASKIRPASGG